MKLIRTNILKIKPYIGGKPIEEVKREFGLKEVVKLASNENPYGPSLKAIKAIRRDINSINRYPDSQGFYLKKKLANKLDCEADNIVLGNGSDELIDIAVKTFVGDGENIITADNTFLEYEIISRVNDKKIITVPLKGFRYDLEAIKAKINAQTKLIFIANPNNPTGTYVAKRDLEKFIKSLPPSVILVLDEAYDNFIDVDDYPSGINYFRNHNLIILKTFSKAYGLAGLRIGYAIAKPGFTSYMERCRQPFNVNSLAQSAAMAALDDARFLKKVKKLNLEGKAYLYRELKKMGIAYVPTVTNFILLDVGCDGVGVFRAMLKKGVIIRDMQQYGLKNLVRVTIGTKPENEKFIRALKTVL